MVLRLDGRLLAQPLIEDVPVLVVAQARQVPVRRMWITLWQFSREFRNGTPAKEIARSVAAAFSRDQVTQYLSAVALHDAARKALQEAGLAFAADVSVTGIDAPREARLVIAADPEETADFASLPARVREALRDVHISLGLPQIGEHEDDISDVEIDEFFLDAQPVRLVKLKPRT